jgi:hypothetical protein
LTAVDPGTELYLAVMVAEPAATPVTSPVALPTEATLVLLLLQVALVVTSFEVLLV